MMLPREHAAAIEAERLPGAEVRGAIDPEAVIGADVEHSLSVQIDPGQRLNLLLHARADRLEPRAVVAQGELLIIRRDQIGTRNHV